MAEQHAMMQAAFDIAHQLNAEGGGGSDDEGGRRRTFVLVPLTLRGCTLPAFRRWDGFHSRRSAFR